MNGAYSGVPTETLTWLVVLLLGSGACLAASMRELWRARTVRHRTRELLAAPGLEPSGRIRRFLGKRVRRPARTAGRRGLRDAGAALGVAAFAVVVIGGVAGWVVAGVGAYGVRWWMRRQEAIGAAADETAEASAAAELLPLAAELMAACLAAGSGPAQAADAVGRSLGGPLGIRLIRTATELRLGAEPAAAWAYFASLPGSGGFVRSMERAGTAGAPAASQMARLTGDLPRPQGTPGLGPRPEGCGSRDRAAGPVFPAGLPRRRCRAGRDGSRGVAAVSEASGGGG